MGRGPRCRTDSGRAPHDAKRLGLGDRIKFVGPLEQPAQLFAAMDVFALTSREDPFPLVMLEAAAAGIPFVCFAEAVARRIARPTPAA